MNKERAGCRAQVLISAFVTSSVTLHRKMRNCVCSRRRGKPKSVTK